MKTYKSFDDIDYELNKLQLERQIAWEEIKGVKYEFLEDMKPLNWVGTVINLAGKYGIFMLIKNFIRK